MTHFVYTTARGLCRTVHAEHAHDAWRLAEKKHKPQLLADLTGATWGESTRGGAIRDRFGDVSPQHARTLYFQACLAEIPIAREEMPRLAAGKHPLLGLERLLIEHGLWDESEPGLSDLGRAFAAWIQGGAS